MTRAGSKGDWTRQGGNGSGQSFVDRDARRLADHCRDAIATVRRLRRVPTTQRTAVLRIRQ